MRVSLQDPESQRVGASLLKLALDHISAIPELRPDYDVEDERLLSSLTQFDILANLAVIVRNDELSGALIYPHFRRFYGNRSDPAVVALLEDDTARAAIFPEDDQLLAESLRASVRSVLESFSSSMVGMNTKTTAFVDSWKRIPLLPKCPRLVDGSVLSRRRAWKARGRLLGGRARFGPSA